MAFGVGLRLGVVPLQTLEDLLLLFDLSTVVLGLPLAYLYLELVIVQLFLLPLYLYT